MKILTGLNTPSEFDVLCDAGADEVYCGIFNKGDTSHGNRALNRREGLAFCLDGYDEFARVREKAETRKIPVHLTLNSFYSRQAFLKVVEQLERVLPLNPSGIIVSDIAVLRYLKKVGYNGLITVGVGGTVFNRETVLFYKELGADRIVLPRDLSIAEIEAFEGSEMEFESILVEGRCFFVDGYCNFFHSLSADDELGLSTNKFVVRHILSPIMSWLHSGPEVPFPLTLLGSELDRFRRVCAYRYRIHPIADNGVVQSTDVDLKKISELLSGHVHMGACGLCKLPALRKSGIDFIKLANRGLALYQKVRSIKLAKEAVAALEQSADHERYTDRVRAAYRKYYGAQCRPCNCYFPEG